MNENLNLNVPHLTNVNIKSPIELQFEKFNEKGFKSKNYSTTEEEKDYCAWSINVNTQRDSYAGFIGDPDLINFFAITENETKARIKFILIDKMLQPCGPPPKVPPLPAEKKKGKKSRKHPTDLPAKSKAN